ncbi:MAG: hypothetical protein ACYCO3_16010, partial [Mycobacteriales bacterium]
ARPLVAFQLARHFERADLDTPEGRVRAARGALAVVPEGLDPLVRDQYLMEVADRTRIPPDDLRRLPAPRPGAGHDAAGAGRASRGSGAHDSAPRSQGGRSSRAAGRAVPNQAPGEDDGPPAFAGAARSSRAAGTRPIPGPESAALVLAVRQPAELADRLERCLLSHPLALAVFDALASADTLAGAVEASLPEVAARLAQLAVSEPESSADDVMVRMVELAGQRALAELQAELRAAAPEDAPAYVDNIAWLKLAIEALRPASVPEAAAALEAERRLVAWLVARSSTSSHGAATSTSSAGATRELKGFRGGPSQAWDSLASARQREGE